MLSEDVALATGGTFKWEFLSPTKVIAAVLNENEHLRSDFAELLGKHSGRLSLIWTADECFSGNPLHERGRKVWQASLSFAKWSPRQLSQNTHWWTPAVVRSKKIGQMIGGASALFASLILRQLYAVEDGLATAGVCVIINDTIYVLFASFHCLVSDGDAWKVIVEAKGASSLRPCPVCQNVWRKNSRLAHRRAGHIEISASDPSQFQAYTPKELCNAILDIFEARSQRSRRMITADHSKKTEMGIGFEPTLRGVWSAEKLISALRFPDPIYFDWAHSALQHGCFNTEFDYFLEVATDDDNASFRLCC